MYWCPKPHEVLLNDNLKPVVIFNSSIDVDTLSFLTKTMSDDHILNEAVEIIRNTLLTVRSSFQRYQINWHQNTSLMGRFQLLRLLQSQC